MSDNKAYIIGVGPGAAEYVTPLARRAVRTAGIVVGWEFNFLPVKKLATGKKAYVQHAADYLDVARRAADEARHSGETVAVLRIGDPCVSGGLDELLRIFRDFDIEVIPGISAVQLAAAAARVNLDECAIVSFHEDKGDLGTKLEFMLDAYRLGRHLVVLNGTVRRPDEVAAFLIDSGVDPAAPVFVGENLTLKDEKTSRGKLGDIPLRQVSWLATMVIKQGERQG